MKLLLDEMYAARLAEALRAVGVDATTVVELRLAGVTDADVFAAALATRSALLTENVGDFTRLAAEHSLAGAHHSGLLIALSSASPAGPQARGRSWQPSRLSPTSNSTTASSPWSRPSTEFRRQKRR